MSKNADNSLPFSSSDFYIDLPLVGGGTMPIAINRGDIVYCLGANGSGKSSLLTRIYNHHSARSKRISAHRQTWFSSNTVDMTARGREELETNTRHQDMQPHARYREWNPEGRAGMAIFDLVDADITLDRQIAAAVRGKDLGGATKISETTRSPIDVINNLMSLANIAVRIKIEPGQKLVAYRAPMAGYSVAELSDGERSAFLIAADILSAKPGTLIIIDEPERHLHRSIVVPLLHQLFQIRKDCSFIVSTHEVGLPAETPEATTVLVRSCVYKDNIAIEWVADKIPAGADIDPSLVRDILGARRRLIFVEGSTASLDVPLYSLLFPGASIIPKGTCRDVEMAVKGLRQAEAVHWIHAWGIIDNDQRTTADIERLQSEGIWPLPYYSVEALYYHSSIISRVNERHAAFTGLDASQLLLDAMAVGFQEVEKVRDFMIEDAVMRAVRNAVLVALPSKAELAKTAPFQISVDVLQLSTAEGTRFDEMVAKKDWDGIVARYPLKRSGALKAIANALKLKDRATYEAAVLKLLADDTSALSDFRRLLGGMADAFAAKPA